MFPRNGLAFRQQFQANFLEINANGKKFLSKVGRIEQVFKEFKQLVRQLRRGYRDTVCDFPTGWQGAIAGLKNSFRIGIDEFGTVLIVEIGQGLTIAQIGVGQVVAIIATLALVSYFGIDALGVTESLRVFRGFGKAARPGCFLFAIKDGLVHRHNGFTAGRQDGQGQLIVNFGAWFFDPNQEAGQRGILVKIVLIQNAIESQPPVNAGSIDGFVGQKGPAFAKIGNAFLPDWINGRVGRFVEFIPQFLPIEIGKPNQVLHGRGNESQFRFIGRFGNARGFHARFGKEVNATKGNFRKGQGLGHDGFRFGNDLKILVLLNEGRDLPDHEGTGQADEAQPQSAFPQLPRFAIGNAGHTMHGGALRPFVHDQIQRHVFGVV